MSDGVRIWLGTLLEKASGLIQEGEPLCGLVRDCQVVTVLAVAEQPEALYDVACGLRRLVERGDSFPERKRRQEVDGLLVRFGALSSDVGHQILL